MKCSSPSPPFGYAKASRLTVPLIQGHANFEEYLVGYATITSDCRGQPFTAPDKTYVAKAIVRVEGSVKVMTRTAKLVDDRNSLVITDKIIFNRSSADKHVWKPTGKSVAARIYAEAKNSYEYYKDPIFGVFVANKSDIPANTCQTARSVWSSKNVTIHKAINQKHSDIIEIRGKHPNSEQISMIIKSPTQICGRTVWLTAVPEIYVLYLSEHDAPLDLEPIHSNELDQWVFIKSLLMSSITSSELSQDHDFNSISYKICENNRQLLISQLREIKAEGEALIFYVRGNPTLPIKSGELVYLFHCQPVMGRIRSLPGICSQELPVITNEGNELFMKPTSRRLTIHYTPRVCSSVTPAGFNLGTTDKPQLQLLTTCERWCRHAHLERSPH